MAARICCLDLDTFFVSVERLLDPSLEGQPVVVGASSRQRGVVTACSYEVRPLGVRSGMPIAEARRLAPQAVFLPTRHGVYSPYARRVREVLEHYTPAVQTASIDEFFLDFHGCEGMYRQAGDSSDRIGIHRAVEQMRQRIREEVGLPASAGLASTRVLAKIASGQAKPAGTRLVRPGGERAFLEPLHVRRYPGIGPVATARLQAHGIHTLGQLLHLPPGRSRARFGRLARAVARGIDPRQQPGLGRDRPAFRELDAPGSTVGSISNERTFRTDVGALEVADRKLLSLVERVAWRARRRGVRPRTLTVRLKYADFQRVSRGRSLAPTTDERILYAHAQALLRHAWQRPLAIRLVGVALTHLQGPHTQLPLPFARAEPPREALHEAVDAVRERFGYDAIRHGAVGGSRWIA